MSSEQIRKLLEDLLEQESTFMERYEKLAKEIKDRKVAGTIRSIAADEGRHAGNAKKMLEILEE